VLEPNDSDNLADLARTLLHTFEHHWNEIAEPFDWNFTRDHLAALINRLAARTNLSSSSPHNRDPVSRNA
jgi:hypothetical protein